MNELLQIEGSIDIVSWSPPAGMTFDTWQEIGRRFQAVSGSIRWWVGDWLNEGERRYGETYTQAIEVTGHKLQYLKDCKWVSAAVQKSLRKDNLSWTHHSYVAGLDSVAQAALLSFASNNELSSRELLDAVNEYKARQLLGDAYDEPPFCNEEHYQDQQPHEMELVITRSMAARDVAATLRQLDAAVLREVVKLLSEIDY